MQILLDASDIDKANFCVVVIIGGCSISDCFIGGCSIGDCSIDSCSIGDCFIGSYFILLLIPFLSSAWLILGLLIKTTFLGLSQSLSSLTNTFRFFVLMAGVLIDHCVNNLAFCLVSSIFGSLAIITCLICGAQTRKCFVMSGLYSMKILSQAFWKLDLDLLS